MILQTGATKFQTRGLRPPRTPPLSRYAPNSAMSILQKIMMFGKCLKSLETSSKYRYGCQFLPCKARASYLVWVRSSDLFKFDLVTRPPGASLALNFVAQPGGLLMNAILPYVA